MKKPDTAHFVTEIRGMIKTPDNLNRVVVSFDGVRKEFSFQDIVRMVGEGIFRKYWSSYQSGLRTELEKTHQADEIKLELLRKKLGDEKFRELTS